jgi:C4-dicarboxylate-specific signal transduction histidine kinase
MMIGVNWDRTAEVEDLRRRSEERSQALHLARLASLGEMAAGVAHEINNPLAILLGSVEALRTRGAKDPEFLERKLKAMEQATSRISQIVKGLQRYTRAKSHSAGHELLGLGKAVEEAVRFCARRAERASVSVHVNVTGSPQIRGESAEIEQMLINLLANGIDAAQGQARRDVWIESGLDGNEVVVRVRDTGPGLAPELAEKIFDPFFTTKAPGSGSGLGLSISRGIAESHGGTIRFVPGEPLTTFEIRLPRGETQRAIGSGSAA